MGRLLVLVYILIDTCRLWSFFFGRTGVLVLYMSVPFNCGTDGATQFENFGV